MTGFFSTGASSTASLAITGFDVVISFTPPVLVMATAMLGASGGAAAALAPQDLDLVPGMQIAAGATVPVEPGPWAFSQDNMRAAGGSSPALDASVAMASNLVGARAGARPELQVSMTSVSDMVAYSGGMVPVEANMQLEPLATLATGAVVLVEPAPLVFTVAGYTVSAGAHVGFYNDVVVIETLGTAQFSTAMKVGEFTTVRTQAEMQMYAPVIALAGATLSVEAQITMEPNDHGPVVRPRAVQGQIIMS